MNKLLVLSCALLACNSCYAFAPPSPSFGTLQQQQASSVVITKMAGFGSGAPKKEKKQKELKLKPKQQWDRYTALKTEISVLVAVKVEGADDWLEVGRVKSKDDANLKIAISKQRVMIAEHSRRLFPLQVSKDAKVEWAYWQEEPEEQWVVVENHKVVLEGAPDGIEKDIGFEGRPDPASGFYCLYNQGRLVDTTSPKADITNEGKV